jgi:pyruvate formate lyase activating enzyme
VNIDKENSLLNKKVVYDLTPFSHLDYPNHLSCIVWIAGCSLRCRYCYNKNIVFAKNGKYSFSDILNFLDKRVGLLDGVVLSGGEATGIDLVQFCQKIKEKNFKIKLDTSGINFNQTKKLIDLKLLDYIALDYKAPKYKFKTITASTITKFNNFEKTLNYLIGNCVDFEVRTTIHTDLLNEDDINFIIDDLIDKKYKNIYYLQNYLDTTTTIGNTQNQKKISDINLIQNSNDLFLIKYRNFKPVSSS